MPKAITVSCTSWFVRIARMRVLNGRDSRVKVLRCDSTVNVPHCPHWVCNGWDDYAGLNVSYKKTPDLREWHFVPPDFNFVPPDFHRCCALWN